MLIGDLARRLRVTSRTLRHYESIGLLAPERTDPRTGYRTYGPRQLARGLRIEQLKAAGLSLEEIAAVLAPGADVPALLGGRRRALDDRIAHLAAQRDTLDVLLADTARDTGAGASATATAGISVIDLPARHGLSEHAVVPNADLGATIRRLVQRLRRRSRPLAPGAACELAARFDLDPADTVAIEVAALVDDASLPPVWPAQRAVSVEWRGPHAMLPVAYDAALTLAAAEGHDLEGTVQETYRTLGRSPLTSVAILLR